MLVIQLSVSPCMFEAEEDEQANVEDLEYLAAFENKSFEEYCEDDFSISACIERTSTLMALKDSWGLPATTKFKTSMCYKWSINTCPNLPQDCQKVHGVLIDDRQSNEPLFSFCSSLFEGFCFEIKHLLAQVCFHSTIVFRSLISFFWFLKSNQTIILIL
jgi:hypothetical protein